MDQIHLLSGVSKGSVSGIIAKSDLARKAGLDLAKMDEMELMSFMYPCTQKSADVSEPDFERLRDEITCPTTRVNVQLLWEEHHEQDPDGIKRSTFYERLKAAGPPEEPKPNMHQVAKGGEKLLIDYSGLTVSYFDADRCEEVKAEIFVASWMASSYLYVEASPSQRKEDWVASHVRALRYFGCAPTYLVPDNLKSGVIKADFYDPTINRVYGEMAQHYGCAILPARSRKPQDKAGVESNVRFIQTHILGRLRNRRFTSLQELNEAIWELLPQINARTMQRYHRSRTDRFENLDQPHAAALPDTDFCVTEIIDNVKVGEDHHVVYNKHYYSAPWRYTGTRVDLWRVGSELLIYVDAERIATHPVKDEIGGYSTNDLHRPPNHLFVQKLKPLWVLARAESIGPRTHQLIRNMITADPYHCETAIRKGLGIVELTRDYTKARVESAVAWAVDCGMVTVNDIRRVLSQELDSTPLDTPPSTSQQPLCLHDNIRGAAHYYTQQQAT